MKDRCDICIATRYCTIKRTYAGIECPSYVRKSADDIVDEMAIFIAYLNRRKDELAELTKTVKMLETDSINSIMFLQQLSDGREMLDRISARVKVKE